VVYGIPTMPGNAGDASGFVQLIDQKGNVLNEADISMAQDVDPTTIFWEKNLYI
jgi:hypothetical protein